MNRGGKVVRVNIKEEQKKKEEKKKVIHEIKNRRSPQKQSTSVSIHIYDTDKVMTIQPSENKQANLVIEEAQKALKPQTSFKNPDIPQQEPIEENRERSSSIANHEERESLFEHTLVIGKLIYQQS